MRDSLLGWIVDSETERLGDASSTTSSWPRASKGSEESPKRSLAGCNLVELAHEGGRERTCPRLPRRSPSTVRWGRSRWPVPKAECQSSREERFARWSATSSTTRSSTHLGGGEILSLLRRASRGASLGPRQRRRPRLGIHPNDRQNLVFDKFYRLDPQLTRGVGGTGLGLYISREFVERMNGRIWLESSPGVRLDVPRRAAGGERRALGGFGGMALVAGVRCSFRGEDAGSADSRSYRRD